MEEISERVDFLTTILKELSVSHLKTEASIHALADENKILQREMKEFKNEMKEFKNEMKEFKNEMKEFKVDSEKHRKEMNKKWSELANKMGTVVEDIVAPNIPRIAKTYFGFEYVEDFIIRRTIVNKNDISKSKEFDIIAIWNNRVISNETKSTPRIDYINDFIDILSNLKDYFPEYEGKIIIPIFSSLSISENILIYLTKNNIYAMAMGDDSMDLLNYDGIKRDN